MFALSFVPHPDWGKTVAAFLLIHLLLYPASNGYNSYMDRDTTSIGGIKTPLPPEKQLYYFTVFMDVIGLFLSFLLSPFFAAGYLVYILFSRLYSYRGIRLKKHPVAGYLTVVINQGALIFFMVYIVAEGTFSLPWVGMAAASLLIGGFYPITQVYQHNADKADGVITLSMLLGVRGTFVFCAILYLLAFGLMYVLFTAQDNIRAFFTIQLLFVPVIIYFATWMVQVFRDETKADYKNTMRMNWIASTFTNLAFLILIINKTP